MPERYRIVTPQTEDQRSGGSRFCSAIFFAEEWDWASHTPTHWREESSPKILGQATLVKILFDLSCNFGTRPLASATHVYTHTSS